MRRKEKMMIKVDYLNPGEHTHPYYKRLQRHIPAQTDYQSTPIITNKF